MKKITYLLILSTISWFSTLTNAATLNVSTTPELREALTTAATNGEDDTIIIADGTYKTTDDGEGTFIYLSNEAKSLTLQGSSADSVILSGDNTDQILNHLSTENAHLVLEKLSFVNGNNQSGSGGGIYTKSSIEVKQCDFISNYASDSGGGYFSADGEAIVTSSLFKNNTSNGLVGGGFAAAAVTVTDVTFENNLLEWTSTGSSDGIGGAGFSSRGLITVVEDSTFINNTASTNTRFFYGGGFLAHQYAQVTNSTFTGNNVSAADTYYSYAKGGGFYSRFSAVVSNSTFVNNNVNATGSMTENTVSNGGGFYSFNSHGFFNSDIRTTISNSVFRNNSAKSGGGFYDESFYYTTEVFNSTFTNNNAEYGGGITAGLITVINSLLLNNSTGIYLLGNDQHKIINSIFDNNDSEIDGISAIVKNLESNYLDLSVVSVPNFVENNFYNSIELGFVDEVNGDYRLTSDSGLIDIGTMDVQGVNFPATDMDGNSRVSGGAIDIGPYEYNPATVDSDGDGANDAEDAFPADPAETIDTDSDGIGNNADTDDDNDGISDTQESTDGTNSLVADTDGDGLLDGQEASNGTNPLLSDTDGDGFSDGYEVSMGADPLDGDSFPSSGLNILLIKGALDIKKAKEESCLETDCANNE